MQQAAALTLQTLCLQHETWTNRGRSHANIIKKGDVGLQFMTGGKCGMRLRRSSIHQLFLCTRLYETHRLCCAVHVNSLIESVSCVNGNTADRMDLDASEHLIHVRGDLLEGELLHGGVGHQVEEDGERLSGLQRFLRQPEEHVLVQLFVHQQLLLAGLVQADAADAQQGVL